MNKVIDELESELMQCLSFQTVSTTPTERGMFLMRLCDFMRREADARVIQAKDAAESDLSSALEDTSHEIERIRLTIKSLIEYRK